MHDHLGHLNLVADKAIFADSWNEGGQKPSKNKTIFPDSLEGGGPSQDSLNIVVVFCFFLCVFVHSVQIFPQSALLVVQLS